MPSPLLVVATLLVAVSAVLDVRAEYRGPRRHVYVFKPLTTALVLAIALTASREETVRYQLPVVIGLGLSLAGDVFLMLPGDRFVPGLASFLLAHVAYIVAFTTRAPLGVVPGLFAPFAFAGLAVLIRLWRGLGRLRLPVLVYVLVIVSMAGQAAGRWWSSRSPAAALAAAGATLFVVSDALLAVHRFGRPFRSAQALIHTSYFLAQWLIAISV